MDKKRIFIMVILILLLFCILLTINHIKNLMEEYKDFDFDSYLSGVSEEAVLDSIKKPKKSTRDFLNMLSPKAIKHLEIMAVEAQMMALQKAEAES
jgi:uncharacterized membrane protein